MFRIADGRECFYQWDSNRKIIVEDAAITELHFCNKTDDCSLVVEVKDGLANVPNILLQSDWDVRVYAFCSDYTKVEKRFKVVARTKPSDYAYTETEVRTYNQLKDYVESEFSNLTKNLSRIENSCYANNTTLRKALMDEIDYVKDSMSNMTNAYNNRFSQVETQVGNIEAVLNEIINLQASYIGGAAE
jgi:hypothetical protein